MAEHPEVLGGGTPIYKEVPVPPEPTPPVYIPIRNPLSLIPAYCFNIFLGVIGAHHAYLRRWAFSFFYVVTGGGFGVGWIVDLFRLNCLVDEANCKLLDPDYVTKKSCIDAYILWFPLGLFGAHHFYLGRIGWGVFYLFSAGGLGIGWLFDAIRMPSMVKVANGEVSTLAANGLKLKNSGDAYCLALIPFTGIFGAHHFYLGRTFFGVLYVTTFGLLGVGWLVDIVRTPLLTKHVNNVITDGGPNRSILLGDCYLCLFPFGFLGLHHFYMGRTGWGYLYLFTAGCACIGWIVDIFRLPALVNDYNHTNYRFLIIAPPCVRLNPNPPNNGADHSSYGSTRSWNEIAAANAAAAAEESLFRDLPPAYETCSAAADSAQDKTQKPSSSRRNSRRHP